MPAPNSFRNRARRAGALIRVRIEDGRWRRVKDVTGLVRRASRSALKAAGAGSGELTILLTGDEALAMLNRRFRGKRKATNVLSFPSADPAYLGDIAIGYGIVATEARAQGKRIKAHAAHLAAHATLHLLGYDHLEEAGAEKMERLEAEILAGIGLSDPYAVLPYAPKGSSA